MNNNDEMVVEGFFSEESILALYDFDYQAAMIFIMTVETGSLTTSARILNLSVSIVSIKLKKFRSKYEYELFTRAGRNLVPTYEAYELNIRLKEVLKPLTELINLYKQGLVF